MAKTRSTKSLQYSATVAYSCLASSNPIFFPDILVRDVHENHLLRLKLSVNVNGVDNQGRAKHDHSRTNGGNEKKMKTEREGREPGNRERSDREHVLGKEEKPLFPDSLLCLSNPAISPSNVSERAPLQIFNVKERI